MSKDISADGLRGLAALNVVLCHFLIAIFPLGFRYLWPGSGIPGPLGVAERVISAPIVSIAWNGNFPVCIFFVLSGYVLSARFSRTGDLTDLTTMALRRFFRLAVPVCGSVLFAYVLMSSGVTYWREAGTMAGSPWLAHFWSFSPTASDALKDGAYRAILSGTSFYLPVLWTMKIELLGSFLVFGYAAIAPRGRMALVLYALATVILAAVSPDQWPLYAGFLAGVHIGRMGRPQPKARIAAAVLCAVVFGAFDASPLFEWTNIVSTDFGWKKHFFNIIGGGCLVYAVRAGFGSRVLSSRLVQYLGRISYSLYLVHFPLLLTLLSGLYVYLAGARGWPRGQAFAVAAPVTLVAACLLASLFQRTFDTWGIALSHRLFPGRPRSPVAAGAH